MEVDLKNKIVVVTGGATGIGYSIAENFSKQSATVIILDLNEDTGKQAIERLGIDKTVFVKCDLKTGIDRAFNEIVEKYKRIDVLVNNAGVGGIDYKTCIDINFTACVTLSLKLYHYNMSRDERTESTIINISSIMGYRISQFIPIYQATKAGMITFTRSLGHEENLQKSGVRVVALCPGFTKTNLTRPFFEEDTSSIPADLLAYAMAHTWQEPSDVGSASLEVFKRAPSGSIWLIEGGNLEEILFQN